MQTKDHDIKVPDFLSANHLEIHGFLPSYHIRIYDEVVEEIEIFADSTEIVDAETAKLIREAAKEGFAPFISISYFKGKPVSDIFVVPILTTADSYLKLRAFSYSYKTRRNKSVGTDSRKIIRKANNSYLSSTSTSTSVLANGEWFKFSIPYSGVFKIDYNLLLKIGINPSGINPRELKIYGNGGGMLPQSNSIPRYDDLVENSIFVFGEDDGKFDPQDYILFYGVGPHVWKYNEIERSFNHSYNLYSDLSYYFLTIGPDNGLRISDQSSLSNATATIDQFDERYFFEKDEAQVMTTPWVPSGRLWIGDIFNYNLQNTYNYDATGIIQNSNIIIRSACVGRSTTASSFNVSINNILIGSHEFKIPRYFEIPASDDTYIGEYKIDTWQINSSAIAGNNFSIKYSFNKNGKSEARGYLDFFEVFIKKKLQLYGNQTSFRSLQSLNNSISEYSIAGTNNSELIWEITDPLFVKNQNYDFKSGQSSFSANSSILKEYIIFKPDNVSAPAFESRVENQNLHGITQSGIPDNLIITTDEFLKPANELAQFHKNFDNLDSYVVTVKKIYNEFSSGAQDISAIRDFIKMVYDRSRPGDSLQFVTLFGDCSVDYKNRIPNNTNLIPVYQSRESLHSLLSYSSDDFYGLLDDNEGNWEENLNVNDKMEIGIGRLPVRTESEAYEVVEKIKKYKSNQSLGKWRNNITLIAGNLAPKDSDTNSFLSAAETLADIITQRGKDYNLNKIYLPSYPLIYTPSGAICPLANEAIQNEFEKGTLILNYIGHGNEVQLSQENILNTTSLANLKNQFQLPFLVAATCQFGRYDFPEIQSGVEVALRNREGGSIGSLAPTRPVYNLYNQALNEAFYKTAFLKMGTQFLTLGEIILFTKNNSTRGIYNRSYTLIGDPCLTLNYPREEILVTQINGQYTGGTSDTLKALQKAKIEGEIRSGGNIISDYNGILRLTLFDKETSINTINRPITTYSVQNKLIYDGNASIRNGRFAVEFIIPKDISYQYDNGKISLYASNFPSVRDGAGSSTNIIIGGSDNNATDDITPPIIKAYLNDESFVFGGITNSNPKLIVNLFDESGINLASSGIGHEISLILDNSNERIILNEFYTTKLDNYKNGTVTFNLKNLTPGNHSLKIKAWDTYNNSSDTYLEFVVVNKEDVDISNVLNYPNPFTTHTEFHFDHNRAGDDIDVKIQIYTVSGKLIKTISERFYISPAHISNIFWDGLDDFGDKIGKGVYVYKVSVKSLSDGNHKSKFQKLFILN
ncbi:hypothetical protein MYP_4848 [Sporocytophaga myxococcoides]|uniref:Gingipain domain-containing protein n=1 Tax=Sporocytophaga myxococcoides TaxID=153721 RepID=A0A098LNB3_9BACT|nr:hypothetical protein MYP_4848 [Sporocytophaga myxococcoides]